MEKGQWIHRSIWGIGVILSLIFISFYGGPVSYGLFFAVLFLPILSLVYLLLVFWRFKIYQKLEGRNVIAGQAVPYYFVLQNEDRFSFASVSVKMYSDFSYVEDVPEGDEYELLPGENFRYDTYLVCRYRGLYKVGIREVVVKDFLGFIRFRYRLMENFEAIVQPKVIKKDLLQSLENLDSVFLTQARTGQKEYDTSVRKYREGDSLRSVHWKASAKMQELMTREMTGEEKQGIALIMDTHKYSEDPQKYLPLENKELEIFLAVGYYLTGRQIAYDACFINGDGVARKERVDSFPAFDELYQKACKLEFTEESNLNRLLAYIRPESLFEYQAVFFVVHEMDGYLFDVTQKLRDRGILSVIYAVTDEGKEKNATAANSGQRIYTYSTEEKLEEVL